VNDHDRFLLLAAEGIDYPLPRDSQRRLATHLAECPSCARRADALRSDDARLRRLPSHRPPAVAWQLVVRGMERRQALLARPAAVIAVAVLLALALAGAAVAGALLLDRLDRRPTGLVEPSPTQRQVATPLAPSPEGRPTDPSSATPAATSPPTATSTPSASRSPTAVEWQDPVRIAAGLTGLPTEHDLSVAVDDAGALHVAASVYDGVVYITNSGGSWSETRISTAAEEGRDGEVSLALDDGTVWIAFTRWTLFEPCVFGCNTQPPGELEGIFLVDNRTGAWADPQLLARGMADPSLAVRGGRFHMAYAGDQSAEGAGGVHYLTDVAGSPAGVQVAGSGSDAHLRLGGDGRPRILFLGEDGLRLAIGSQSNGSFEVLDGPSGTVGVRNPSLALDDVDRAWAAWSARDDLAVHVSRFDPNGKWSSPEQVLRGGSLGGFNVDADGSVHLVTLPLFLDDRAPDLLGGLWYATNRTGDFVVEQLRLYRADVDSGVNYPSAIAVDGAGRPHIVFRWQELRGPDDVHYVVGPIQ